MIPNNTFITNPISITTQQKYLKLSDIIKIQYEVIKIRKEELEKAIDGFMEELKVTPRAFEKEKESDINRRHIQQKTKGDDR